MAKGRKFVSGHKKRKRRSLPPGSRPKRKRNPNDYRIPEAQLQKKRDGRYIGFQGGGHKPPRRSKLDHDLRIAGRCDTVLGGKKVWKRGKRPDHSKYSFPIIIDATEDPNIAPMRRCTNKAVVTKCEGGKTIRRCREHIGIEWVEHP